MLFNFVIDVDVQNFDDSNVMRVSYVNEMRIYDECIKIVQKKLKLLYHILYN